MVVFSTSQGLHVYGLVTGPVPTHAHVGIPPLIRQCFENTESLPGKYIWVYYSVLVGYKIVHPPYEMSCLEHFVSVIS